ncbi:ABC transporter ATP-binding protein [Paraburkholderia nemoris]|uniref:ABC transporter ATP-binding protein n=1 Tax=Paraburkholderia nemoris TaxID=2793076 RepID=UPI0038B9F91A
MLVLSDVCKRYKTRNGKRLILNNINLQINQSERVGILGRNGSGKSTLIRLVAGSELPTTGDIARHMSISWPLAFTGGFQGSLTGLDNLRFVCRVYGASYKKALPFVEEFTELGSYLREPVKKYSSGMLARLAFAMSMAIEFDCFLIDEVIAVGDASFQEKCHNELFVNRRDRAMIMVSHDPHIIREHCTRACVLEKGVLTEFADVNSAFDFYYETTGQSERRNEHVE